jgi:tRNA modification GTPase
MKRVIDALSQGDLKRATAILEGLLLHAPIGRHLVEPWRVIIAGAANVGKSTLVNALAGYQRSIVADTPGTTRDVVTTRLAIDGWPIEISDTAGWRSTTASLEQEGIERARRAMAEADLCLWLLDGSTEPVFPGDARTKVHYLINKIDLPPAWDWTQVPHALVLSARTGSGVTELCQAVSRWLVPAPPPPGVAVPFTALLCTQLRELLRYCQAGNIAEATRCMIFRK